MSNGNPLGNRYSQDDFVVFDIVSKTDDEMTLRCRELITHGAPVYFGAILSNDREEIYWVNTTRPLP